MDKEIQKIRVNESVVNTYSYLKGNYNEDEFVSSLKNDSKFEIINDDEIHFNFDKTLSNDEIDSICERINAGVNEKIVKDFYNGKFINIKFKNQSTLNIKNLLEENLSTAVFNVECDTYDSHLYFYSEILGSGDQFNYLYNIDVKNNSKVTLVIFSNSKSKGFINLLGNCESNCNIEVLFINVNKNNVYTNCKIYLNGEKSCSNVEVCYICSENHKFDYNITSSMIGKESISNINGKGVLLDNGEKIFRGTVDFQKGCLNAEGCENEEVIILSKNVKNQSLPLLLCKEKNVKGSHGFTANSIDEDKIFYLLSRGFNEKEAKGLILRGKFLNLLKEVKNEEIVDKFMNLLMEAI